MNELKCINNTNKILAEKILKKASENNLIPYEKKSYLSKHVSSVGPYLAIEGDNQTENYIIDASSQIATLGLGFNHPVLFGTAHHIETWTNNKRTEYFKIIRTAMVNFFKRNLKWPSLHTHLCNSGAEANEIALGQCYNRRIHKNAKQVLAFKGSFHGRLLISLCSTWNPSKREPFEWEEYKTLYAEFPKLPDANIKRSEPNTWKYFWANESTKKDFTIPKNWELDEILTQEIESLKETRTHLLTHSVYAIIIEPMQCEGGDQFGSARFFNALLLMAKAFKIPIIFDEVQTGFHLGQTFFWHSMFQLKDENNIEIYPDYVTCAKKAQVGIVLSHHKIDQEEQFSVANAVRGFNQATALLQNKNNIINMELEVTKLLEELANKHPKNILNPRNIGLCFSFDLREAELVNEFVNKRFDIGMLYYPAGDKTLRFRLNLAFSKNDLIQLFDRIDHLANHIFKGEVLKPNPIISTRLRGTKPLYEWQKSLLEFKRKSLIGNRPSMDEVLKVIKKHFQLSKGMELIFITKENFSNYSSQIKDLQKRVYEPSRQTSLEKFQKTLKSNLGIGIAVKDMEQIHALAFVGPLNIYPFERGTRQDPFYLDPNTGYMLDVTVDNHGQGQGLGRQMKYSISLLALAKGITNINGRNRDILARKMIDINLSLGSIELNWFKEDYPDFEESRDVYYYGINNYWIKPPLNLSSGIESPLGINMLTASFMEKNLPQLVNKVCLSNFVNEGFLNNLKQVMDFLPQSLQHGYTTSGQSECVDKIVKSIWYNRRKDFPAAQTLLTFNGHFFGMGSFLSRTLSEEKNEGLFKVEKLENPTIKNQKEILSKLKVILEKGQILSVWIEPILQNTMERVPLEFLKELKVLLREYKVPLVYNETASSFYRFNKSHYMASNNEDILPDAGMIFLGGSAGLVFTNKDYFLEKPLMLISTWDGDEFSLSTYVEALTGFVSKKQEWEEKVKTFEEKLKTILCQNPKGKYELENGIGFIKGDIPLSLSRILEFKNDRYLVRPNLCELTRFIDEY